MRKRKLVILAALEMETRAVAKALGLPFRRNCVLMDATATIELYTIGMRAEYLPNALSALAPSPDDLVWLVGLGGALDPSLQVGDLVIDGPPGTALQPADASFHRGRIHTSDRLVATPAQKRALFAQTAALAVDMEQRLVRDKLAPLGISVMGVRAISDTAETALEPHLLRLVTHVGRPRWAALAAALLRRPSLLVSLVRLGRDSSRAVKQLTRGIQELVELGPYNPPG